MADLVYMARSAWTALLDSIRSKGGTSAPMTAAQAKAAVEAIETGGAWSWDDFVNGIIPAGACVLTSAVSKIPEYRFYKNKAVTSVDAPGVTLVENNAFSGCSNLEHISLPACTVVGFSVDTAAASRAFSGINGGQLSVIHLPVCTYVGGTLNFENCGTASKPLTVVLPNVLVIGNSAFQIAKLAAVDVGENYSSINAALFYNATVPTLIMRRSASVVTLTNTNAFKGSNFKSGGVGGTIYIPKALYDHLGDGTALDYKAATNWSTVDGYGTITWAQIEGSIYENQYADGTPVA